MPHEYYPRGPSLGTQIPRHDPHHPPARDLQKGLILRVQDLRGDERSAIRDAPGDGS